MLPTRASVGLHLIIYEAPYLIILRSDVQQNEGTCIVGKKSSVQSVDSILDPVGVSQNGMCDSKAETDRENQANVIH